MPRAAASSAPEPPRPLTDLLDYLTEVTGGPVDAEELGHALTHRSYAYEAGGLPHNERLEFLGDSVLGVVVTHTLFTRHPDLPEGQLAKLRAAVDDARTSDLAYVSQQTGPNLCSLAVPVRDESGACIAGINLIVHGAVLSAAEMTSRYLSSLKQAAASLGLVLPSNAC